MPRTGWSSGADAAVARLAVPNRAGIEIVRRIKRHGPAWGNLGCRSWHRHAGYSSLPPALRRHPRLCVLRDVRSWYGSYCVYYTSAMPDTLLSRAIRMLAGGEDRAVPGRRHREILSRHRGEFLARLRRRGRLRGLPRRPVGGVPGLVHPDRSPREPDERMGGPRQAAGLADGPADLSCDRDPVRRPGEGVPHAAGRRRGLFCERAISGGFALRPVPRLRPPHRPAVPGHGRASSATRRRSSPS